MVESLLKFVTSENLFTHEDKILLAVSGGIDSMVMAQLFINAGISFSIAHVNYNLRGSESVADRDFVLSWGKKNEVEVHVREVDEKEYESKESIQMVAREIRYTFFDELCHNKGFTKVATAHHLNDSFETVLLNLIKGTGPSGLKGIPIQNEHIIRPMMFTSRDAINNYASVYRIKWREDASNSKTEYQRNFIRKEISGRLKEINPSLEHTFKDTLVRLTATADLVSDRKQEILNQFLTKENELDRLNTKWVKEAGPSLLILSEIASDYGLNFRQSKDLYQCVLNGQSGKIFESNQFILNVDRGCILITQNKSEDTGVLLIEKGVGDVLFDESKLTVEVIDGSVPFELNSDLAFLDYDKLKWPLKLRHWNQGDVFRPLGLKGKKRVSDFMIDNKIPVTLKGKLLILESNGEIVWLVGKRISEDFKITPQTNKTLKLSVRNA